MKNQIICQTMHCSKMRKVIFYILRMLYAYFVHVVVCIFNYNNGRGGGRGGGSGGERGSREDLA